MLQILYKPKAENGNDFIRLFHDGESPPEKIKVDDLPDYYEVSRILIQPDNSFQFLMDLSLRMLGGIYYIMDKETNVVRSFKVNGRKISEGEIIITGLDEENELKEIKMSDVDLYFRR